MLNLVAFIVVIGVLIFVHELGHFVAAKALGVQVLRFSIGFGPAILSWRRGETEYRLAWIPLGGYVKMAGLEDEGMAAELEGDAGGVPVDPERAFDRKPVWVRVIVLSAGVTMNLLLAFFLYTGLTATVGTPQLATTQIDTVDVTVLPPGAEALRELQHGDQIVRINGDTVASWNDVLEHVFEDETAELRFEIAGRAEPLVARLRERDAGARRSLARALGYLTPPRLGIVNPGQPASRAGLEVGDHILRANGDSVRSWSELAGIIRRNPDRPVQLDVRRGDTTFAVTVVPAPRTAADTAGGARIGEGIMGATSSPDRIYVRRGLVEAVAIGARETVQDATLIVRFLGRLFSGDEPVRQLGGPVLIAQISGQVIRMGLPDFLGFLALFSVQLAVLNLLPIPVLDGGHLVFLVAEWIRGRPIPVKVRVRLLNVGFWILIAIMVLVISNDVIFRILPG
jgi:regulator of sigma E protease